MFNYVSNKTDNSNYVYFHEERGMTSLLVVINNTLCAYSSFENTEYNYRLNVASIVDSHIQGLEKTKLNVLLSNKNIPFLDSFGSIDLGA